MPTTILDGETYEQARHRRFTEEAKVIEKMQQDEIIRMALEACAPNQTFNSDEEWIKRFAALVAEATGIEQQREIMRLKAIIEEQANGAQNLVLAEREFWDDLILNRIKAWSEAYPVAVFPEPDFRKAHEVLQANGITLDAISASNMRHVITQVQSMIDAAVRARSNK